MEINKSNKIKITIMIIGIIALLIGASWALINIVFEGDKEHSIKLNGGFSFSLDEPAEGLNLTNSIPMNDKNGIVNSNEFEFTVSATSEKVMDLNYYLSISTGNDNTLSLNNVKFYLKNVDTGVSIGPMRMSSLTNKEGNEYYLYNDVLNLFGNIQEISHTYKLKVWVDEEYSGAISTTVNGKEQTTEVGGEIFSFSINAGVGESPNVVLSANLDKSGANVPEIVDGMIPIYYDGSEWRKASVTNSSDLFRWYSYATSGDTKGMWANIATVAETSTSTSLKLANNSTISCAAETCTRQDYLDAEIGTVVPIDDINTMFVWIPRFSASGDFATYNGTSDINNPGAFNITFVDKKTSAHDAFTLNNQNLSGLWIGKFETSAPTVPTSSSTVVRVPIIKPDVKSWRYSTVKVFYNSVDTNMNTTPATTIAANTNYGFLKTYAGISADSTETNKVILYSGEHKAHVSRNNEWGAVAYLTQSLYGRCTSATSCTEVSVNNSSGYYTGRSAGEPGYANITTSSAGSFTYNTLEGQLASTTGNIYGIYDMSGGSYEIVLGNYNSTINNSGFSTGAIPSITNIYTTAADYTSAGLQHALVETAGWYGDSATFVGSSNAWFLRGGYYTTDVGAGIFYYDDLTGAATVSKSFRTTLVIDKPETDTIAPSVVSQKDLPVEAGDGYEITIIDNVGITGYMITTTSDVPAANSSEWRRLNNSSNLIINSAIVPENGNYYLYLKDSSGNVSDAYEFTWLFYMEFN